MLLLATLMWPQTGPRVVAGDNPNSMWAACATEDVVNGLKGTVKLQLVVNQKGEPRDIKLVRSLRKDLDKDAIDQVRRWRFQPAMREGKPVTRLIQVEVNYDCTSAPKKTAP